MFTIKLEDQSGRLSVGGAVEATCYEVEHGPGKAYTIVARHDESQPPTHITICHDRRTSDAAQGYWSVAYIMNSDGKTIDVIRPPLFERTLNLQEAEIGQVESV